MTPHATQRPGSPGRITKETKHGEADKQGRGTNAQVTIEHSEARTHAGRRRKSPSFVIKARCDYSRMVQHTSCLTLVGMLFLRRFFSTCCLHFCYVRLFF